MHRQLSSPAVAIITGMVSSNANLVLWKHLVVPQLPPAQKNGLVRSYWLPIFHATIEGAEMTDRDPTNPRPALHHNHEEPQQPDWSRPCTTCTCQPAASANFVVRASFCSQDQSTPKGSLSAAISCSLNITSFLSGF